jgi:glyoxylase-like metal-dependent hydrolase (beta-lactamase superfamily II)
LSQLSCLVGDESTGRAVVVDPHRDVSVYVRDANERGLRIERVIETHVHADFLSVISSSPPTERPYVTARARGPTGSGAEGGCRRAERRLSCCFEVPPVGLEPTLGGF